MTAPVLQGVAVERHTSAASLWVGSRISVGSIPHGRPTLHPRPTDTPGVACPLGCDWGGVPLGVLADSGRHGVPLVARSALLAWLPGAGVRRDCALVPPRLLSRRGPASELVGS